MSFNLQITKLVLNGQILHFLAFVEKPAPDHYLPPLRDQSGNRFSLVAAGWLSIFRTHCVTACGREITPGPNPPGGRTTTTVVLWKESYSNVHADRGEEKRWIIRAWRLMKHNYEGLRLVVSDILHLLCQVFHQQLQHLPVLLRQPVHQSMDLCHPGLWVVQLWTETNIKRERESFVQ